MNYDEVVKAVNRILAEYNMPLTLRQIYYRLVAGYAYPNTIQSYKNLSKMLVKARENGEVKEKRIEDRARQTYGGDYGYSGDSIEDYIDDKLAEFKDSWAGYTRPMWATQPLYVEVWVEKDALRRVVDGAARPYRVTVAVSRGYNSYSFLKSAADRMQGKAKPVILYLGDHDPSGIDIQRDLAERLERYGVTGLTVARIALTPAQIRQYNMPAAPAKESDARTKKFVKKHGNAVVELDAMEPPALTALIKREIEALIDVKRWNETIEQIEADKAEIRRRLEEFSMT